MRLALPDREHAMSDLLVDIHLQEVPQRRLPVTVSAWVTRSSLFDWQELPGTSHWVWGRDFVGFDSVPSC